jgi:catalase
MAARHKSKKRKEEQSMTFMKSNHCFAILLMAFGQTKIPAQSTPDLAQQIAEIMAQGASGKAHQRYIHAKGIVCKGTFEASVAAPGISLATHFSGESIPITVRFSDGAPDSAIADSSPDAAPRGMAIRFETGRGTDIMAISHNGFITGTGEEFLELEKAVAATDSTKPHPWPIEAFLGTHPRALKFVQDPKPVPVSFATESFYNNNALIFINDKQERQAGRYFIVPVDGPKYLNETDAKAASPNFLMDELRSRLAAGPAKFRLQLQLAGPEDPTNDSSIVWPNTRRIITIASVVPDSASAERALAFDPTHLIDGIELSDDPLPMLRSRVYVYSVIGRRQKESAK